MRDKTRKEKKKQAFSLQTVMVAAGTKNRITVFITDACFVWLYLLGLTLWLFLTLQMQERLAVGIGCSLAVALLQQVVTDGLKEKRQIRLLLWAAALVLIAVAVRGLLGSGLHQICNYVIAAVGQRFPYMLPAYAVTVADDMKTVSVYLALFWLLLLFCVPAGYLVRSGNRILLGLQFVVLLAVQLLIGTETGLWGSTILWLCLLAVWLRGHGEKTPAGLQRAASLETVFLTAVLAVGLVFGGAALCARFIPEEGTVLSTWKTALREKLDDYRYKGESQVLPDGRFQGLTSFAPQDTTALQVTMSQPESCYLRGFIGSTYTNDGWTGTEAKKLWGSRDLFYWLHQDLFYGQGILGNAAVALGDAQDTASLNTITVENISGNARYVYTPYELKCDVDSALQTTLERQKIGDCGILAGGFKGERSYTYEAYPELVTKYPSYAEVLLDTDNLSEAGKTYASQEEYYNEFVYATYLDVPERLQRELHSLLGDPEIKDGEKHTAYAEAKQNILYLLTEKYTDSNEMETRWNGSDFIYEFLEISKKGYAVHFASAATMMFRYYGIPARYVEGYLITPKDRDSMTAGEPYAVDETHAHAWVEYYQDGVGWLPFETTPSYLNTMGKAEEYQDISGVSAGSGQDQQEDQQDDQQDEEEQKDDEDTIDWTEVIIVILFVGIMVLLLLLCGFLIWILVQRHKSRKLKRQFDVDDMRVAIAAIFEYTMNIFSAAGLRIRNTSLYRYEKQISRMFDEDTASAYHHVVDIRQQAVYSRNTLTKEQRDELMQFKNTIWQRIYDHGSLLQKLQLKFIYFL